MNCNKLLGHSKGKLVYWNLVTLKKQNYSIDRKYIKFSTIQVPEEENHRIDYQNKSHNQTGYVSDHTDRLVVGVCDQVTNFILNRVSQTISVLEHQCSEQSHINFRAASVSYPKYLSEYVDTNISY